MAGNILVDRLYDIIRPIAEDHGLELVEVQYRQEQHGWVLRILIYKEDGVSLEDCSRLSRETGHVLDVEDVIPTQYHLEVSSPGLGRPLTVPRDFARNRGKKITLTLVVANEVQTVQGVIDKVDGEQITVKSEQGVLTFTCDQLRKARLVIEF